MDTAPTTSAGSGAGTRWAPRMRSVHASSNSAQAEVLSVVDGLLQLRVPNGGAVWVWSHEPWTADAGAPVTVGEVVQLHAADVVSDGDVSWVRAVTRVDEWLFTDEGVVGV